MLKVYNRLTQFKYFRRMSFWNNYSYFLKLLQITSSVSNLLWRQDYVMLITKNLKSKVNILLVILVTNRNVLKDKSNYRKI